MPNAVIVDGVRTPIGRAVKGSLREVRPDDMGGLVIDSLLKRVGHDLGPEVDDVIWGTAVPEGEQGYNIARNSLLLAGLPVTVTGLTVNRFCASSLECIRLAASLVRSGEGSLYLAGGVDSYSRAGAGALTPAQRNPRFTDPTRDDYLGDMYADMIRTAELVASRYGITRVRMDELALDSHRKAVAAQNSGAFSAEILPVETPAGMVVQDDVPRPDTNATVLAGLSPVLSGGTVTAGNACPLSDGAAAVMVTSDERASELGLTPRLRIVSSAVAGVDPSVMGIGPIEAIRKALAAAGMTIGDLDVVELNEAFAAQVLAVCDETKIDIERQLNPHGGAIALGHPFGSTGARIMTTLMNRLALVDGHLGMETMCIGGGMGMAMIVERMS